MRIRKWNVVQKGFLYLPSFSSASEQKESIKGFLHQVEFDEDNDMNQIPYVPFFKPMYRVVAESSSSGWDYAEADFSGATGYLRKEKEHE